MEDLCNENKLDALFILSIFRLSAPTCFLFIIFYFIKVLLLAIFSVHTPGYKNDLNCSFNRFTWVVTHPVRGIKGSDLVGFDSAAVKNRINGKNTAIGGGGC